MASTHHSGTILVTLDPGAGSLGLDFQPVLVLNDHQQTFLCLIWCIYLRTKIQAKELARSVVMRPLQLTLVPLEANNHPSTRVLKGAREAMKTRWNALLQFEEAANNLLYPPMMLLLVTLEVLIYLMIPMNIDQNSIRSFLQLWLCLYGVGVLALIALAKGSLNRLMGIKSTNCGSGRFFKYKRTSFSL